MHFNFQLVNDVLMSGPAKTGVGCKCRGSRWAHNTPFLHLQPSLPILSRIYRIRQILMHTWVSEYITTLGPRNHFFPSGPPPNAVIDKTTFMSLWLVLPAACAGPGPRVSVPHVRIVSMVLEKYNKQIMRMLLWRLAGGFQPCTNSISYRNKSNGVK